MINARRAGALTLAATFVPAATALAAPTIAEIAPPETVLVAGVDNCAQYMGAIDRSLIGAMWRDPAIRAWIQSGLDDESEGAPGAVLKKFRESLERAGVEEDELSPPTGMAGFALWFVRGTEDTEPEPRFFLAADFGDNAPAMREAFVAMTDQLEEDDESVTIERDEHGAASVWTITVQPAPVPEIRFDEDWQDAGDENMGDEEPEWDVVQPDPETYVVAWSGAVAVLGSDRAAMEHAVDRLEGAAGDSVSDSDDFQRSMTQVGSPGAYLYGAVAPFVEMFVAHEGEALPGGPEAMLNMLDTLGVRAVRAFSAGFNPEGPGGSVENTFAVLAPRKAGLLALFDGRLESFTPPPSVGADATTVFMFRFDYAQLFPTLNRVIAAIPDEAERQQAQMGLGFFAGGLAPLMAAMSPETTISNTVRRPFTNEPDPITLAVGVTDEAAIKTGIETMSPMLGFEARDFQGNQLWASPMGVALGMGGGRLFAGPVESVENALRQAGDQQALRLAGEQRFQRAASFTRPGGMLYVWSDLALSLEKSAWTARNFKANLRAELAETGWAPDEIEQFMVGIGDDPMTAFMERMPPAEVFTKYMSDSVAELHSTDDGFRGRSLTLPPP